MADSTLAAIRKKVRRLTRTPSDQQLSTADIDEYVNTFIQYDFPQHLRLFTERRVLTFYTEPNIDTYATNDTVGDPLYNFENRYTAVHEPIYVAGYEAKFVQGLTELTSRYPITNKIEVIGKGDGLTNIVTGTLTDTPIIRNMVTFSATEIFGNSTMRVSDDGNGALVGDVGGVGTIDYVTGDYYIEFVGVIEAGTNINALTVPYTAARPDTVLYFANRFTVRPIPDQVYPIIVQVDLRPTELFNDPTAIPVLEQWWQYIAYGAAKKVFEDRSDKESIADIMPEFNKQELLVLRRTIVQQSKERAATIYSNGAWIGYGNGRSGKF